ncbi:hypothetical protein Pcinc_031119 [Petrolisthes cinctipes]|uniref:RING-type E3 ubiquitin transferase BRCA1 n=1 Tax=Petrolisthes cinctipes TaxID=88211 RepID=A0AAE1EX05_PETCI|nr:hypothetical protein Pcinc_031119 [Petrolisthes cinctipes]
MEDRLEELNAILQSMQQTLQCYICLDLMNNPLTTKCGHSFCSDCIGQVVKGPRNSSQCPICVNNITKRSLTKNTKKIALVLAVRKIVDSIKRDCCFEVTPSKYRPRPRPTITTEEDDSENEENDEPRRGTRKRGVTEHYIPEIHVPKPRARAAKQKVLATNGKQELSLHSEGVVGEENGIPSSRPAIVDVISEEHSYSSPTKQEPLEKPSTAAVDHGRGARVGSRGGVAMKGQGRSTGRGGQNHGRLPTVYPGKAKNDNSMLSVSQCVEKSVVLPESLPNSAGNSEALSEKLGREKPADKVAKWLHTSRELGFRIGASNSISTPSSSKSSESMSTTFHPPKKLAQGKKSEESSTDTLNKTAQGQVSSKQNPSNTTNSDRKIFVKKTSDQGKTVASVSGEKKDEKDESASSSIKRIFKTKTKSPGSEVGDPSEAETQIFGECDKVKLTPSSDPYNFIPSQKTPKKVVQKRGGGRGRSKGRGASAGTITVRGRIRGSGVISKGRVRGTGRGVLGTSRANTTVNDTILSSVNITALKQSTPVVAGRRMDRNVNISAIKSVDLSKLSQEAQVESYVVHTHDDDDDDDSDHGIPDSCPVNTKDEFDAFVSEVKNNESVLRVSVKKPSENEDNEEQEAHLLFVTPAQEEQKPPEGLGKEEETTKRKWSGEEREEQRRPKLQRTEKGGKRSEKGSDKDSVCNKSSITSQTQENKKRKTKADMSKLGDVGSVCNKSNLDRSQVGRKRKTAAEKAREEVEALCSMFEDIEDHQLKTVSEEEEEKVKKSREEEKNHILRQNISNLNDTIDNTEFNRTNLSVIEENIIMPPPKVPTGKRKVRFDQQESDSVEEPKASTSNEPNEKASGGGRSNVRYASELRVALVDISKSVALPVATKTAKSPGWSHVERARKDLKDRHTSLDISGGEERHLSDTRTEGGTSLHSSTLLPSSGETNVTIEDATQEFDVEHLDSSQNKKERVLKLKRIVSKLKGKDIGEKIQGKVVGKEASLPKNENKNPVNGDTLQNPIEPGENVTGSEQQEPVLLPDTEPFPMDEKVIEEEDQTLPIPLSKLTRSETLVHKSIIVEDETLPVPLNKFSKSKALSGESVKVDSQTLPTPLKIPPESGSSVGENENIIDQQKDMTFGTENDLVTSSKLSRSSSEKDSVGSSRLQRKTFCLSNKTKNLGNGSRLSKSSPLLPSSTELSAVEEKGTVQPQTNENERVASTASASNSSVVSKPCLPHHVISSSPATTLTSALSLESNLELSKVLSKKKQTDDDLSNISIQSAVKQQNHSSTQHLTRSDQKNNVKMTVGSSSQLLSDESNSNGTQKVSRVVPFKSVGPLCSNGCVDAARNTSITAADEGDIGRSSGLGRDLCLHAVPCEVYQVLMKYMALLTSQHHSHRGCCGCGQDAPGYTAHPPNKPASDKERKDLEMAPSEVDEGKYPPQATTEEEGTSEDEVVPDSEKIPSSFNSEDFLSVLPLPGVTRDGEKVDRESKVNQNSTKSGGNIREQGTEQGVNQGTKEVGTELAGLKGKYIETRQKTVRTRTGRRDIHETISAKKLSHCRQVGKTVSVCQVDEMDHDQNFESEEIALDPFAIRMLEGYERGSSQDENMEGSQMSTSLLSNVDERRTHSMKSGQGENAGKLGKKTTKLSRSKRNLDENTDRSDENVTKLSENIAKPWDNTAKCENIVKSGENKHEKKTLGNQKTREKNTQRTDVEELVEIEKENLKNASLPSGNLPSALGRPKRKPLQSGQPVLENIMSHTITDGKNAGNTDKLEVPQIQDSQKTKPTASKSLLSPESSVRLSRTKGNNALINGKNPIEEGKKQTGEVLVIGKDSLEEDTGSSDEARNVLMSRTSKRKYHRINRPASSGSSSENSDSEPIVTNPRKRIHRAISSSSSNPGNASSDPSNKFPNSHQSGHNPEDPNLHDLDSEEMRDLNRLDLNVWEVFGHPDPDLVDHDNDHDRDSVVSIEEISSQQDQEQLDEPPPVTLSGMSDEEIPSTADVMRNVNLDLDIIKKTRQGTSVDNISTDGMSLNKSEPVAVEAVTTRGELPVTSISVKSSMKSESSVSRTEAATTAGGTRSLPSSSQLPESQQTTSVAPTLSVDTRTLLTKVDRSLSRAEQLLDKDNDLFEDLSTPQDERDQLEEKSNNTTTKNKGDGFEESDVDDPNSCDEGDTVSHSSTHSSQSEAVSTQRQQQVKNEVEQLKARVRELEAAMRKKEKVEEAELAKMVKVAEEVEEMESSELQKGEREELSPTCPIMDSDSETEEIFSSLPDISGSNLASVLDGREDDEIFRKPVGPAPRSSPKKQVLPARPSSPPLSPPPPSPPQLTPSPPPLLVNQRPVRYQTSGPPRLVCTGLNSYEVTKVQQALTNFGPKGSSLRKSWGSEVTHVVVKSEEERRAQRTLKYLFGVAAGCWVVDLAWAVKSLAAQKLQSEEEYEVLDCTGVDGPRRGRISSSRLFGECEFFLLPPFKDVSVSQLKELVELCGGTVVDSLARFSKRNKMKLMIIETEGDYDNEDPTKKYKYVTLAHDWLLECIGMYSHICISPYLIGSPTQQHFTQSCLPLSLLKETQEL